MFFELRQYGAKAGKRADLVHLMERDVIPFQVAQGMVIVASFVSLDDENGYVWIRRFESEEEKERLYQAVYQSDHWKQVIAPKVAEVLDREAIRVTRMSPTAASVLH